MQWSGLERLAAEIGRMGGPGLGQHLVPQPRAVQMGKSGPGTPAGLLLRVTHPHFDRFAQLDWLLMCLLRSGQPRPLPIYASQECWDSRMNAAFARDGALR